MQRKKQLPQSMLVEIFANNDCLLSFVGCFNSANSLATCASKSNSSSSSFSSFSFESLSFE